MNLLVRPQTRSLAPCCIEVGAEQASLPLAGTAGREQRSLRGHISGAPEGQDSLCTQRSDVYGVDRTNPVPVSPVIAGRDDEQCAAGELARQLPDVAETVGRRSGGDGGLGRDKYGRYRGGRR
jgi:hypothetical protein